LPRGASEQILTANHFADLHGSVVHYAGELVGGNIVVPPDHEIPDVFSGDERLWAKIVIGEGDGFAIGNTEAPREASGRLEVEGYRVLRAIA
jgi:hypothetical protein